MNYEVFFYFREDECGIVNIHVRIDLNKKKKSLRHEFLIFLLLKINS